jgi:hypothetical protein
MREMDQKKGALGPSARRWLWRYKPYDCTGAMGD